MPRSAIIWTRSRELSLEARYHLTHRMMISWSKCRPSNRSCAEVGFSHPGRYGCAQVFSILHQNRIGDELLNQSRALSELPGPHKRLHFSTVDDDNPTSRAQRNADSSADTRCRLR